MLPIGIKIIGQIDHGHREIDRPLVDLQIFESKSRRNSYQP